MSNNVSGKGKAGKMTNTNPGIGSMGTSSLKKSNDSRPQQAEEASKIAAHLKANQNKVRYLPGMDHIPRNSWPKQVPSRLSFTRVEWQRFSRTNTSKVEEWITTERLKDKGLVNLKILLNWFLQGFSIQTQRSSQAQYILWLVSKYYKQQPDGQCIYVGSTTWGSTRLEIDVLNPFSNTGEWYGGDSNKIRERLDLEIEEDAVDYEENSDSRDDETGDDSDESSESEDPDRDRRKERNVSDRSNGKGNSEEIDDSNETEQNASGVGTSPRKSVTKASTSSTKSKSDIQRESGEEEEGNDKLTPSSNKVARRQQYIREPVIIPELCKDGETVTAEMMITFLDALKRAIANDQEIKKDLSTLIPQTTYYTLNKKLTAAGKKDMLTAATLDETMLNLRNLYNVGYRIDSAAAPTTVLSYYLSDLASYFKTIFRYPLDGSAIDQFSAYANATLKSKGIQGRSDVQAITEEESKPFITSMLKYYKDKAERNRFFGLVNLYMTSQQAGMFPVNGMKIATVDDFITKLAAFFGEIDRFQQMMADLETRLQDGGVLDKDKGKRALDNQSSLNVLDTSGRSDNRQGDKPSPEVCQLCGRTGHAKTQCLFVKSQHYKPHPLVLDLKGQVFQGSSVQKRLKAAHKMENGNLKPGHGLSCIPFRMTLKKAPTGQEYLVATDDGPPAPSQQTKNKDTNGPSRGANKVSFNEIIEIIPPDRIVHQDLTYLFYSSDRNIATEELVSGEWVSTTEETKHNRTTKILLDSGAINYNFISLDYVRKYKLRRFKLKQPIVTSSIHGNEENTHCVFLDIKLSHKNASCCIPNAQFIIINECAQYELIIGLYDIRRHDLTGHLREYFIAHEDYRENTPYVNHLSTGGPGNNSADDSGSRPKLVPTQTSETHTLLRSNDSTIQVYPRDLFLSPAENTDHMDELLSDQPLDKYFNDIDRTSKDPKRTLSDQTPHQMWEFKIDGTEENVAQIRKLLEANRDCFSTSVSDTPAKVTPFAFDVDKDGWTAEKANKARARVQSAAKNAAIDKFISQAIADNVIAPSDAPAWSQVLLTPKSNGTWRFALTTEH